MGRNTGREALSADTSRVIAVWGTSTSETVCCNVGILYCKQISNDLIKKRAIRKEQRASSNCELSTHLTNTESA